MTAADPKKHLPADLAAKLRAARASRNMQGERRVVTILFCDVADSTAIAEQLDPEAWVEIMNAVFEFMISPVYRYEGTVARLMGDSILAFFGAPIAHEDDPQRAVLAGLGILEGMQPLRQHLLDTRGIDLNVRVGIHTGEVVVGEVGTDFALEYTAMGDAVNLAARMEQTARPGTVQVTEETHKRVAGLFDFETLGAVTVKGKRAPVTTYRPLRTKEQPERPRGIETLTAPLTGRDREIETLKAVLQEVHRGHGQLVFLIGEAGLGKSRLIEEMRPLWEKNARYGDTWLGVRGVSYEKDRPYGLISHFFRQRFGITPADTAETMYAKIMEELGGDPTGSNYEMVVQAFTSLSPPSGQEGTSPDRLIEGEELKGQLIASTINIFRYSLSLTPLAFVIDDLQWADPASIELIQHLSYLSQELPALFLCALRPHRQSPGWSLRQTARSQFPERFTEIQLQPLSGEENDALIVGLLETPELPGELRGLIHQKAEGNPFFVEEVIRTLIDNGDLTREAGSWRWTTARRVADIAIPDNLIALLTARVDRLSSAARRTLQVAAVIGRTFDRRLLAEVSGIAPDILERHLEEIRGFDLARVAGKDPQSADSFRHDLTREAVYHSILHRRRRELHRQVAEGIERLAGDHLNQQYSRLAFHFDRAERYPQAQQYYTLAGDEAARLFAHPEAITHYRRALELTQQVEVSGDRLTHLFQRLGRSLELASRFADALETYLEMERVAKARGDRGMELKALIHRGRIHATPNVEFNFKAGEQLARKALALAKKLDEREAQARVYWNQVNLYRLTNHWAEGRAAGERAVALARQLGLKELLAHSLNDLSHIYMSSVDPQAAHDLLLEASDLWRELGNKIMLADTLGTKSLASYLIGDFDTALEHSMEAGQISRSINNPWGQSYSLLMIGDVYWERGQVDRAISSLEQSILLGEQAGFLVPQVDNRAFLGLIYGYLGDFERGLGLALKAAALAENSKATYLRPSAGYLAELYVVHGHLDEAERILEPFDVLTLIDPVTSTFTFTAKCRLLLAKGAYTQVLELADDLLELLRPLGFQLFIPKILYHRGEALRSLGRLESALESLQDAQKEAQKIGSRAILWLILAAMTSIEATRGNPATAERLRAQAIEIIEYIAGQISEEGLRSAFLNMGNVKSIRQGKTTS